MSEVPAIRKRRIVTVPSCVREIVDLCPEDTPPKRVLDEKQKFSPSTKRFSTESTCSPDFEMRHDASVQAWRDKTRKSFKPSRQSTSEEECKLTESIRDAGIAASQQQREEAKAVEAIVISDNSDKNSTPYFDKKEVKTPLF